jgi:predicted nucleotidyltransferase
MLICGIVAEYNPFHSGHTLHIEKTRALLGKDTGIVCVMSGNFVQRGDYALLNKHSRAEAAVMNGADLVLELPSPFAVSSAENFAFRAVYILDALKIITHLSFGSECGSTDAMTRIAQTLTDEQIYDAISMIQKDGSSFAKARQKAVFSHIGKDAGILSSPNNILGVEYIKALIKLNSQIKPVTVPREGAAHDGPSSKSGTASASYIRALCERNHFSEASEYMPPSAFSILMREAEARRAPVLSCASEIAILSNLRRMTEQDFSMLPDASEGLHLRLRKAASQSTLQEVLDSAKTKRYAYSRIRRMVLCAYLGITAPMTAMAPPYVRVLAFNRRGRVLINTIKDQCRLPLITKPAAIKTLLEDAQKMFSLESKATDLYVLSYPGRENSASGQEWRISPIFIDI